MSLFTLFLAVVGTIRGTVLLSPDPETGCFAIKSDDASKVFSLRMSAPTDLRSGDRILIDCEERRDHQHIHSFVRTVTRLGTGDNPNFPQIGAKDVNEIQPSYRLGRLRGHVRDAVIDDIDPVWAFLTVDAQDGTVLAVAMVGPEAKERLHELIGADIEMRGLVTTQNPLIARQHFGKTFSFLSLQNVTVLKPRERSLFDAPDIEALKDSTPREISASPRHRIKGRVLAAWNRSKLLIRTD